MKQQRVLIDIGNSKIKWALVELSQNDFVDSGDDLEDINAIDSNLLLDIWISSVATESIFNDAVTRLSAFDKPIFQAKTGLVFERLNNGYNDYSKLGIDRWLTMVYVANKFTKPSIIVDAGSAITLDYIDEEGCFVGGWILPGLQTSLRGLNQNTSLGLKTFEHHVDLTPSITTEKGVANGIIAAAAGAIERFEIVIQNKEKALQKLITGGDGLVLKNYLAHDWEFDAMLVLKGLAIYALNAGKEEINFSKIR